MSMSLLLNSSIAVINSSNAESISCCDVALYLIVSAALIACFNLSKAASFLSPCEIFLASVIFSSNLS